MEFYLNLPDDGAMIQTSDYYGIGQIITSLFVDPSSRGKKYGSQLLTHLCLTADERQVVLFLEVVPTGDLDFWQLKDWYMRYGFKDWRGVMRRRPTPHDKPTFVPQTRDQQAAAKALELV